MSEKRLGVGFVGAGFITNFHIQSWVGVRDADVAGFYSRTRESAEQAAKLARDLDVGSPRVFDSVAAMVADPTVEAIWICVPNYVRIEIMQEIAEAVISGAGALIGVACEKPLGRTLAEALTMRELASRAQLLDGYLENQVFAPSVTRGKELLWSRGAALAGPPYLARAAEEHSGPHKPWFWDGKLQGGGVLSDMMCHSVEVSRFLLTSPELEVESLRPVKVSGQIHCLKWQRPRYARQLAEMSDNRLDYARRPAEDFARVVVEYSDPTGQPVIAECTTSWCFQGAGLRLSMELLGPEYSMAINTLDTNLKLFLARDIEGQAGEDLLEKQNAESGLMPVIPREAHEYGYTEENRHMVQRFLRGERPRENFDDGVRVAELLMASYLSAEQEKTIAFPVDDLQSFVPEVARGKWNR